jgi:hypothetical protein
MANELSQLMGDDTGVTEQFFDTLRDHYLTPERDLLIAILDDAISTYRKYRWARDPEGKDNFREAEEWIMKGSDEWIFSFNSICALLGLAPDYIRRRLRDSNASSNEPNGMA